MRIVIIGFEREGRAAYEYWNRDGNELTICDQDVAKKVPEGVATQLGPDYLKNLDRFDVIVRTAGMHPKLITKANPTSPQILDKVTTSVNELIQASPSRNIIGVTGTKGKGTTCALIAKMLETTGHRVHLGGNIGIAPLELLNRDIKSEDWVVLELSSFQLMDLKNSPPIAVCLTTNEEHLNWHSDMDEYIMAKQQLFKHQSEDNIAIYYADSRYSLAIAQASPGLLIPYMQAPGAEVMDEKEIVIEGRPICKISEIKLLGKHNWQNICAALTAVWNITQDVHRLHDAITNFSGLPYRLQLVRELGGVQYYNDSASSAPDATIAALQAVGGSKVLIVGGLDKKQDFNELAREILAAQHNLRRVIIIGQVAPRIEAALKTHGFTNYDIVASKDVRQILNHAQEMARPGDKILFSPGTSSFDMFKDIEDRSRQFTQAVQALV